MLAARYNRPGHDLVDHRTFTIASDGDIQEGVASEACSLAGHLGLGKLTAFYDDNKIQLAGETSMAFSEDVPKRFEAYGWHVQDLAEEWDVDRIVAAVEEAEGVPDRPSLIVVRTHIGYGAPNLQDTEKAHGSPLGEEEVRLTKEAYGWDPDEKFLVPDEALEHFRGAVGRGEELEDGWRERAEAYRSEHPELWEELSLVMERRLSDGWDAEVPRFRPEEGMIATRKASNKVIQWAAAQVPHLVSGSADLEPSTLTLIDDGGSVAKGDYAGRNVHYGVREHGMGAIVNGLNLHGLRAFGSTFFNFLDYMKGAVRLAAIMHLPSIFVFTHDSIGLGEDGPTHQPIEQLAHLRATPNLYMIRPAGANETALAWRFAIEQTETPVAMALSRQGLPVWNPSAVPADCIHRGAYVLRDSYKEGRPDLILIATGSEVHVCTAAADLLESDGIATRVVSAPCLDRFAEQDQPYRDQVLPPACRARVSVEAASPLGWAEWTTEDGEAIGMTTFGASAPHKDLYEQFGFTPERVAERGKAVVERLGERSGA
jgi:transketolase